MRREPHDDGTGRATRRIAWLGLTLGALALVIVAVLVWRYGLPPPS